MLNLLHNSHLINQLEWNTFIYKLNEFALFKNYTLNEILRPLSVSEIKHTYTQFKHFKNYFHTDDYRDLCLSIRSIEFKDEINNYLLSLSKQSQLEIIELNTISLISECIVNYKSILKELHLFSSEQNNDLAKFQNSFLKPFRRMVSIDGNIDYMSHPELRDLFQEQIRLESEIRNQLNYILNSNSISSVTQFSSFDVINDYYTIPIKSDSYHSSLGRIISRSQTGSTLYVEPIKIRDLNIQRLDVTLKLHEKINSILRGFSITLFESIDLLFIYKKILNIFDNYNTRILFSEHYGLCVPNIAEKPEVQLENLFHPLIKNPVKNDVNINSYQKGIVISGPNTGGKTALIKATCLSVLFFRYGLCVPASTASIYPYENIYYFGNDQQNLLEGLSSFAAEVKNYTELITQLGETNIIFIDEIFNSTSSDEASALSVSYIEEINNTATCHIMLSTHHQMLKTFMHNDDSFVSCHVGFDTILHAPTYKLIYGIPGSSLAIEIFKKIAANFPFATAIYNKSQRLLNSEHISYESLLAKVAHKQNELDAILKTNKQLELELKNQKMAMEGLYKLKLQERLEAADLTINKIIERAENNARMAKNNEKSIKSVLNENHAVKMALKSLNPTEEISNKKINQEPIQNINVGSEYFCSDFNCKVTVQKIIDQNYVSVNRGSITLKVPIKSLYKTTINPNKKFFTYIQSEKDIGVEHDLRGLRLDEFENRIQILVSDLLLNTVPFLIIIHGHGDGILKKWLREYIRKNKALKWEQGQNGNDGETRIYLSN